MMFRNRDDFTLDNALLHTHALLQHNEDYRQLLDIFIDYCCSVEHCLYEVNGYLNSIESEEKNETV